MNGLIPALAGGLTVAGLIGIVTALRPIPLDQTKPDRNSALLRRVRGIPARTRVLAGASVAVGLLLAVLTGWMVAVLVVPAAVLGLPFLVGAPPETARINRLEAMAEWTRNLAGVLTVGVGLEQALVATLRSTPEPIKAEVSRLVAVRRPVAALRRAEAWRQAVALQPVAALRPAEAPRPAEAKPLISSFTR